MDDLFEERVELCNDLPECSTVDGLSFTLVVVYMGVIAVVIQTCSTPGE